MIRRNEIGKLAHFHRVPERTIQKDYIITRVLRELGPDMPGLGLRFKGGTCLKKCHFEAYRYSEDLDFTVESEDAAHAVKTALDVTSEVLTEDDVAFDLGNADEHENGFSYVAKAVGPLGSEEKLKIDVTTVERLFFRATLLPLFDPYSDRPEEIVIRCYSLEEVFLEKLICLLDRARQQPRDLYDLNYLMESGVVDFERVAWHFAEKARFKKLDSSRLREEIERKSAALKRDWEARLSQQLPKGALPGYEDAERKLLRLLREYELAA